MSYWPQRERGEHECSPSLLQAQAPRWCGSEGAWSKVPAVISHPAAEGCCTEHPWVAWARWAPRAGTQQLQTALSLSSVPASPGVISSRLVLQPQLPLGQEGMDGSNQPFSGCARVRQAPDPSACSGVGKDTLCGSCWEQGNGSCLKPSILGGCLQFSVAHDAAARMGSCS